MAVGFGGFDVARSGMKVNEIHLEKRWQEIKL